MSDLISRKDALDILCKFCGITEDVEKCRKTSADGWCREYCELKNMPRVEAIPVEWINRYKERYEVNPEEIRQMLIAWEKRCLTHLKPNSEYLKQRSEE